MVFNNINAVVQSSQERVNVLLLSRAEEPVGIREHTFSTRCSCRATPSHNN